MTRPRRPSPPTRRRVLPGAARLEPTERGPGATGYEGVSYSIADRLSSSAIFHEDRCTWFGDSMELVEGSWQVVHKTVDESLYAGTSGIALLLARAWRGTGRSSHRDAAEAAIRQALWRANQTPNGSAGLYSGLTGVAWAALDVGTQIDARDLVDAGRDLAHRAANIASDPNELGWDLIDGLAGTIVGLVQIGTATNDGSLVESAIALGGELRSRANSNGVGLSWAEPSCRNDPCGLAHGASGPAYAFLELLAVTGDSRFRTWAEQAAAYERGWFEPTSGGWPDLRGDDSDETNRPAPSSHWCHGAAGIGRARLRAWELTGSDAVLADLGAALRLSERLAGLYRGQPSESADFSLCHGAAGTASLLLDASRALGVPEHRRNAEAVCDSMLSHLQSHRSQWPCGVPGGGETPGLMLGLAGIGLLFLRMSSVDPQPHQRLPA